MFNNINMPDKIKQDDLKKLFEKLNEAIDNNKKEDFIKIMKNEKDKFNMKIDSLLARGNTLNHSIARAVNDNYCNNDNDNNNDNDIDTRGK